MEEEKKEETNKESSGDKAVKEEEKDGKKDGKKEKPVKAAVPKKKGGWLQKVPAEIFLSPGGMILIFFALLIEIIDWVPLPFIDQIIELPLELLFIVMFAIITKVSFKSLIIPFVIERIPFLSDIFPTWFIRFFV